MTGSAAEARLTQVEAAKQARGHPHRGLRFSKMFEIFYLKKFFFKVYYNVMLKKF